MTFDRGKSVSVSRYLGSGVGISGYTYFLLRLIHCVTWERSVVDLEWKGQRVCGSRAGSRKGTRKDK